jgi:hypothetical protein
VCNKALLHTPTPLFTPIRELVHRMVTWLMSSRERMERGSSSRYTWAMMALLHHNDCSYDNLADELAGEDGEGQQQQVHMGYDGLVTPQ